MSQLGLWLLTGTVPEKVRNRVTTGDGRREGLPLAVTQLVSGLVKELVCVDSWALNSNSLLQTRGTCSKEYFQLLCKDLSGWASEEGGAGAIRSHSGHLMG